MNTTTVGAGADGLPPEQGLHTAERAPRMAPCKQRIPHPQLKPLPRTVLRVGFAGSRKLNPNESVHLKSALDQVFSTLGEALLESSPNHTQPGPLLRLVTGLCEGADAMAAEMLENVHKKAAAQAGKAPGSGAWDVELAGVLPFGVQTYRDSRPELFREEFDRQLARTEWILELDGIYDKPDPDTPLAKNRRGRAYRAQAAFLLRHSDLLIAAGDPNVPGGAGGTLETLREAQILDLPVVFIHTGDGTVHLVQPDDDWLSVVARTAPSQSPLNKRLPEWVAEITASPFHRSKPGDTEQDPAWRHGAKLLEEFFDQPQHPPCDAAGKRKVSFRESFWEGFVKRFRSGPDCRSDEPLKPFATYRERATNLNRHYSGLYRGAFLLNYTLAILAVGFAAVGLTLLGTARHTAVVQQVAEFVDTAVHQPAEVVVDATPRPWLLPALLVLAVAKLGVLGLIAHNRHRANQERWNDRAVDYRYLAERLRGMFYLPLVGSHQPPAAAPAQFASRVIHQSAVDWLFRALVRAISPADLDCARPQTIPSCDGEGTVTVKKVLRLEPLKVLRKVRDRWIGEQAKYHDRNARTMETLRRTLEAGSQWLGWSVIVIVAIDLLILAGRVFGGLPDTWKPAASTAVPWLIFIATVLPAVVAALGGIRFQSECQRLAERSAVLRLVLAGRADPAQLARSESAPLLSDQEPDGSRWQLADHLIRRMQAGQADPATDLGCWSYSVLRVAERVATDFVQEAAEWSVLYAKEVSALQ